jgi:hypothetical protein
MKKLLLIVPLFCFYMAEAQNQNPEDAKMKPEMTEFWDPEVPVVTPGERPQDAPSDAIILFDGSQKSLNENWTNNKKQAPGWKVADNCVTVVKGTGTIQTKLPFEDVQLHIEWRTPAEVVGNSQGRGNSGSDKDTFGLCRQTVVPAQKLCQGQAEISITLFRAILQEGWVSLSEAFPSRPGKRLHGKQRWMRIPQS